MISLSTRRLAGLVAALSAAVAVAVPAYAGMTANQPPDAVEDSYSTDEDVPLTVGAPGVLGNDTDPDAGSTLTATEVVTPPKNGSVTLNPDGSFTFTPKKNSNGEETFDYRACDNGTPQACDVATVTLTVAKVPVRSLRPKTRTRSMRTLRWTSRSPGCSATTTRIPGTRS